MSSTVEGLDRGVQGTSATIEKMHKLVALGKLDPTLQKIATWIRMSVPQDQRGKTTELADAVFQWTKDHGIFQSDPFQIEKIEHPIEAMRPVIQNRQNGSYTGPGLFVGDCDTFAVFVATLGGILGFQYSFETAKVDASRPDEYSHVWASLLIDGNWYPLDSSTPGAYPGWRPPVTPDLLARWPEHPIEDVVKGADMSAFSRGLGDNQASPLAPVDAAYPKDYIAYGIPKDFGAGPGVIPVANFDDIQLLPPHDTQIPDADLQPDMHFLKAAPLVNKSERVQSIAGQPDDHGNPYYQTQNGQPYYKVENQFYPPGSRWNGPMGQDIVRYVKTGAYVKVKAAESPERQVRTNMGNPMLTKRRNVVVSPRRVPYGVMEGFGDDTSGLVTSLDPSVSDPSAGADPGFITSLSTPSPAPAPAPAPAPTPSPAATGPIVASYSQLQPTPTPAAGSSPSAAAAASAGGSVWDSISAAFKAAGTVAPAAMQSSLMQTVIKATNALAGKNVLAPGTTVPWYLNPVTLITLGLIGGGTYYVMHKNRPGTSGRRRRY
jgi:hypothetical protein